MMNDIEPGYKSTSAAGYLMALLAGVTLPQMEPDAVKAALLLCPAWVQVAYPLACKALGIATAYLSAHSYARHRRQLRLNAAGVEQRTRRKGGGTGAVTATVALALILGLAAAPAWAGWPGFLTGTMVGSTLGGEENTQHKYRERHYQADWCNQHGGKMEVILPDKSRCDCLTSTHAVEVDFSNKWAESIGQALNYARQTERRAGVLIITKDAQDRVGVERIRAVAEFYHLPLDVFTVVE